MNRLHPWLPAALAVAVVASGVGVVYAKFLSRNQFALLQSLRQERDQVETRWVRLQLEQGVLATYSKLELDARKRLGMHIPETDEVVVLK